MKYFFLLLTILSLVLVPSVSAAQQSTAAAPLTEMPVDTLSSPSASETGDDYSRYTPKGPKDNLWKFSIALSLFLMVVILMLLTRRKKRK